MGRRSPALGQARALDAGNQEVEGILSPPLPAASFSLAALLPRRQARPLLGPDRRPGDVSADPCVLHHPWTDQRRRAGRFCRKTAAPLKRVMKVGTGLAQKEASARLDKRQSRGLSIIFPLSSFVACCASFFQFYFCKILMAA